jgi:hypothetical protein
LGWEKNKMSTNVNIGVNVVCAARDDGRWENVCGARQAGEDGRGGLWQKHFAGRKQKMATLY